MKSNRDELRNIVERADIPSEWKKILQETFDNLCIHNDSVLREIKERVLHESDVLRADWTSKWNIVASLVSTSVSHDLSGFHSLIRSHQEYNFEEYLNDESQYINVDSDYFLNCSYEDLLALCSRECTDDYPYKGRINIKGKDTEFSYRLVLDLRYIEVERVLYNIADVYNITKPVIFSPYSRRAVKIQIPKRDAFIADLLRDYGKDLDPYRLQENNLSEKLLIGKTIVWNLRMESIHLPSYEIDENKDNSSFSPYDGREIYRYKFKSISENAFICPSESDVANVIEVIKDIDRRQITIISREKLSAPCWMIRVIQPDTMDINGSVYGDTIFSNIRIRANCASFSKERLRTEGDIESVLNSLSDPEHGFSCRFCDVTSTPGMNQRHCLRYSRELAYGLSDLSREQYLYGKRRNLLYCYVTFLSDSKFLDDYANYVLSFLEHRYPDFQWVGVV